MRTRAEAKQVVAATCDLYVLDDLDVTLRARLIERCGLTQCQDAWDVILRAVDVRRDLGIALAVLHTHVIHQIRAKASRPAGHQGVVDQSAAAARRIA